MCPLCTLDDPERVVREGRHWRVKHNRAPYKGLSLHLVIFAKTHIDSPAELSVEAKAEYFDLVLWAQREFNIPGCGVIMRLGDTRYHGGSIPEHLHGQIMVPDGTVPVEKIFYQERA